MSRLASAGVGLREQVAVADFLAALRRHRFVVRGVISLGSEPVARSFVLDDMPVSQRIGPRVGRYDRAAFVEAYISGRVFCDWWAAGSGKVASLRFAVPKLQEWATWERQPSRWTYGSAPIPWPILKGEVSLPQQSPAPSDYNFLIRDGLPTFSAYGDAVSHYLFPGEHVPPQALPTAFITARIADTRCWIDHMHFAPGHLVLTLKGRVVEGARVELIGPQSRREKKVGKSGRVKISIPRGVDPQEILVVSRSASWLDYRYLGRSAQEGQPGVTFEPPDRCTQIAIQATQGEHVGVEYKRQLPSTDGEREKLARTVVAFANTQGGYLIYGVEREGAAGSQITGVHFSSDVADSLVRIIRDRVTPDPSAEVVHCLVEGKSLVAVVVPSQRNKFFALNTRPPEFYVRRQANTFPATLAEIRELAATQAEPAHIPSWRR